MNLSYPDLVETFFAVGLAIAGVKVFLMGFEWIGGLVVTGALFLGLGIWHETHPREPVPWKTVFFAIGHLLHVAGFIILLFKIEEGARRSLMTARAPLKNRPVVARRGRDGSGDGVVALLRDEIAEPKRSGESRAGVMTAALQELIVLFTSSGGVRQTWSAGGAGGTACTPMRMHEETFVAESTGEGNGSGLVLQVSCEAKQTTDVMRIARGATVC